MAEIDVRDGVARLSAPGTEWLSTGANGGRRRAPAAYNLAVPEGWSRTDLDQYVDERLAAAGFEADGPALLTGVEMRHARGARLRARPLGGGDEDERAADGSDAAGASAPTVTALATAGVTNPAALFPDQAADASAPSADPADGPGTVNVLLRVDRALAPGALANLVAVAAEAKAATLLREAGVPGTTTDAVVVGCRAEPTGEAAADPARFTGSATPIGAAARACVRDAVRASLRSRYESTPLPESVADAEHGVVTARSAEVFRP